MLIEVDGWRILTDPTFDPPGQVQLRLGDVLAEDRRARPIAATEIGPLDAILLSHDHHEDNLDAAGRALLPSAGDRGHHRRGRAAARRQRGRAGRVGDDDARGAGRPPIEITATPCRHGPPLSHPIVGDVIGFALAGRARAGALWISGDTVLYHGVREVAGCSTSAPRSSTSAACASRSPARSLHDDRRGRGRALRAARPERSLPIHYEGWTHFRRTAAAEQAFASAPGDLAARVRWLDLGVPTALERVSGVHSPSSMKANNLRPRARGTRAAPCERSR